MKRVSPAVASNIPRAQITFSQLFLRVHSRNDVMYGAELSYRCTSNFSEMNLCVPLHIEIMLVCLLK